MSLFPVTHRFGPYAGQTSDGTAEALQPIEQLMHMMDALRPMPAEAGALMFVCLENVRTLIDPECAAVKSGTFSRDEANRRADLLLGLVQQWCADPSPPATKAPQ